MSIEPLFLFFIKNGAIVDLDNVFINLLYKRELYGDMSINFDDILEPTTTIFLTYKNRAKVLDLIMKYRNIIGNKFISNLLLTYKFNITKHINDNIQVIDITKIIINYIFSDDLHVIINLYA